MFSLLTRRSGEPYSNKGVRYGKAEEGEAQSVEQCLFCDVSSGKAPGIMVYENEEVSVFRTVKPYTDHHLLVTPRKHIQSVLALEGEEGAQLVERCIVAGRTALNSLQPGLGKDALLCFHVPPFNSVDHLHLHAIGCPHTLGFIGKQKYQPGRSYCLSAEQAVENLREQQAKGDAKAEEACKAEEARKAEVEAKAKL